MFENVLLIPIRFHVGPQQLVDTGLITPALPLKPVQHVAIETYRDNLLSRNSQFE